jgi:hypothetical protein
MKNDMPNYNSGQIITCNHKVTSLSREDNHRILPVQIGASRSFPAPNAPSIFHMIRSAH